MSPSIEFLADAEHRLLHGIRSRTESELLGFVARFATTGRAWNGVDVAARGADDDAFGRCGGQPGAVDALLRVRATEDAGYFQRLCARVFDRVQLDAIAIVLLHDYRQRCARVNAEVRDGVMQ